MLGIENPPKKISPKKAPEIQLKSLNEARGQGLDIDKLESAITKKQLIKLAETVVDELKNYFIANKLTQKNKSEFLPMLSDQLEKVINSEDEMSAKAEIVERLTRLVMPGDTKPEDQKAISAIINRIQTE